MSLQHVLLACSHRHPEIGYCQVRPRAAPLPLRKAPLPMLQSPFFLQGMNFVAGLLLLVAKGDEASAFWMLVGLLEHVGRAEGPPLAWAIRTSANARCHTPASTEQPSFHFPSAGGAWLLFARHGRDTAGPACSWPLDCVSAPEAALRGPLSRHALTSACPPPSRPPAPTPSFSTESTFLKFTPSLSRSTLIR